MPGRTMPQSGQGGGGYEVEIDTVGRTTRAAQRNIYIVPKPERERYMLTVPEFSNIVRHKRHIEIGRDLDVHHQGRADGDVSISGEITIDLKSESIGSKPEIDRGEKLGLVINKIDKNR